jgi:polar amino acid transport system substrate-binding protein
MRAHAVLRLAPIALFLVLPAACSAKPSPTPPPASPAAPAAEALVFGTSTGYAPFSFYDAQQQLDGFDVALARALGEQMGVPVELKDMAFDGLFDALQLGQIDAAIAAISITPERQALVDFSEPYYLGEDAVLGASGANRTDLQSLADLGKLKVGVQRGTVYETTIQTQLIDTGQMPAANLSTFVGIEEAVAALKAGQLDAVMLDSSPAQDFVQAGGVTVVAAGLAPQDFGIALPKGDSARRDAINSALAELRANGTMARLYSEFLLPPSGPAGSTTPPDGSLPTPTAAACLDGLALDMDLTMDDQDMAAVDSVPPGAPFVKAWRVRNTGTCTWDGSYALVLAAGDAMGGQTTPISGTVSAGASYDLQLKLTAPDAPGTYRGIWQMSSGQGSTFGERLDAVVLVPNAATATPPPSPTPAPDIGFSANPTTVTQGQQVTFNWNVANSRSQYFYRQGDNWAQFPVGSSGSRVAWPTATTVYELRVIELDGSTQMQQITITVAPTPGAPVITKFTLNPPAQIPLGACVDIAWTIDRQVSSVLLFRGQALLMQGTQSAGKTKDCPPTAGTVTYRLEAVGPDGTARASRDLSVIGSAPTVTPFPTGVATPSSAPQVLTFQVNPPSLPAGQCFSIVWNVTNASLVRIRRGTGLVLDHAPLSGNTFDCPITPGQVSYRLEAVNESGQSAFADSVVTVRAP